MRMAAPGTVYLVGAGPGDPELLTLRAARLIGTASCLLHDDLVPEELLSLARPDAVVCNVGKRCGQKSIEQHEIHRLMIEHTRAGHSVVRLKSGDPMVFGRAGEEMQALSEAAIPFEVIPGITAASAAAAAVRIPLTDRRGAARVLFTTGHHATPDRQSCPAYAPDTTLVRYMPGKDYAAIRAELMDAGWPKDTQCIVLSHAGLPTQQIQRTSLADLSGIEALPPPSILMVFPMRIGSQRPCGRALSTRGDRIRRDPLTQTEF